LLGSDPGKVVCTMCRCVHLAPLKLRPYGAIEI